MFTWTGLKATGIESTGVRKIDRYSAPRYESPEAREQREVYEASTRKMRSRPKRKAGTVA